MRLRYIRQPEGSHLCGQSCVAMAAGLSLAASIKLLGHERATTTKELITALRASGLSTPDRLHRVSRHRPNLPSRCIAALRKKVEGRRTPYGHWILIWDGQIYDPDGQYPEGYDAWKLTSYLEIF